MPSSAVNIIKIIIAQFSKLNLNNKRPKFTFGKSKKDMIYDVSNMAWPWLTFWWMFAAEPRMLVCAGQKDLKFIWMRLQGYFNLCPM